MDIASVSPAFSFVHIPQTSGWKYNRRDKCRERGTKWKKQQL
nr:MAG TPA: hypothetical protein [Caudoviricetes sp.]